MKSCLPSGRINFEIIKVPRLVLVALASRKIMIVGHCSHKLTLEVVVLDFYKKKVLTKVFIVVFHKQVESLLNFGTFAIL